jgi:hypothetical protein
MVRGLAGCGRETVASFKVLSLNLLEETEKYHQSEQVITTPRSETWTFGIRNTPANYLSVYFCLSLRA